MQTTRRTHPGQPLPVGTPTAPPRRWHVLIEGASASVRRRALERRLVAGEDPASDPLLARRAAQLASPRMREVTAASLRRLLDDTRHIGGRRLSSVIPASRREVLLAEPFLLRMIVRLRDGHPIWPAGIARIRDMLADGCSPLYTGERPGALREWAQEVLVEFDDGRA
jgi:hypothetical protein